MSTTSSRDFRLLDEPSIASVSMLTNKLNADLVSGSISSKAFDHRARVARQQTALLRQRMDAAASLGKSTDSEIPGQVRRPASAAMEPSPGLRDPQPQGGTSATAAAELSASLPKR